MDYETDEFLPAAADGSRINDPPAPTVKTNFSASVPVGPSILTPVIGASCVTA